MRCYCCQLKCNGLPKFKFAKRSCRDRWTLLRGKYKKRISEEIKAFGIDAEVSEIDAIIKDLVEKEDAAIANGNNGEKWKLRKRLHKKFVTKRWTDEQKKWRRWRRGRQK